VESVSKHCDFCVDAAKIVIPPDSNSRMPHRRMDKSNNGGFEVGHAIESAMLNNWAYIDLAKVFAISPCFEIAAQRRDESRYVFAQRYYHRWPHHFELLDEESAAMLDEILVPCARK
jgi:hypothetical protein